MEIHINTFKVIGKQNDLQVFTIRYVKLTKRTKYVEHPVLFPQESNPLTRAQHGQAR
jgi:hypothetical protein